MQPHVGVQHTRLGETFSTDMADVGFLTSVCSDMNYQLSTGSELFRAVLAFVGSLSSVNLLMLTHNNIFLRLYAPCRV